MYQRKLPADPTSLILGILSLCLGIVLSCCGLSIVGLVLSIVGLVTANKSLQEYNLNPNNYSLNSRNTVNTAKIVNIISIVINGLITLIFVGTYIIQGTLLYSKYNIFKDLEKDSVNQQQYDFEDEENGTEEDTIYNYQDSISQE